MRLWCRIKAQECFLKIMFSFSSWESGHLGMRPARQQALSPVTDIKAVTAHVRQGVLPVFPGLCLTSSLPEKKGAHWEGVKCQAHKDAVQAGRQPGTPQVSPPHSPPEGGEGLLSGQQSDIQVSIQHSPSHFHGWSLKRSAP